MPLVFIGLQKQKKSGMQWKCRRINYKISVREMKLGIIGSQQWRDEKVYLEKNKTGYVRRNIYHHI